jgi:poly-gamma-glutamate synthesis protein (capsule biosynthesis protein)
VGDVLIDRDAPERALEDLDRVFAASDIRFANCECSITDSAPPIPGAGLATVVPTSNAVGFCGFDVVSLANNHVLDAGHAGLDHTLIALASVGCRCIGAGANASIAWEPHVVEVRGTRIGFIALTSVLPKGWNATRGGAGVAGVRAHDVNWTRHPHDWGPGVAQRQYTAVEKADIDQLKDSVKALKRDAEIVVVSVHWGDYSRPYVITPFERWLARELAACDVDVILGHHQHSLRGVERIGRTLVLYGLGNLIFDHPRYPQELDLNGVDYGTESITELEHRLGRFAVFPRDQNFPLHFSYRFATVAQLAVASGEPAQCELTATIIDPSGRVRALGRDDDHFEIWISEFDTALRLGEVVAPYRLRDVGCKQAASLLLQM